MSIDIAIVKLFMFVDVLFTNNKDLSSQIGFIIILTNKSFTDKMFSVDGNLIH
jgi:hypothetical protein